MISHLLSIYNILYFTSATAGLEGERDAVSGKIVGAGVRLGAAQCREMTDGIISDPRGTGTHDHNHRRTSSKH